jgi:hypothetical protein
MLTPVTEFNIPGNLWKLQRIAEVLGENVKGLSELEAAQRSVNALRVSY